jgi:hypothetical protein
MVQPSSITTPLSKSYEYYAWKGQDPVVLAVEYVQAWAAKVPVGTQMILAKVKCALADGPCGCPEDSTIFKCKGPNPPVGVEILLDVLKKGVEGVEMLMLPAPEAIVGDGHVHFVEGVGPDSSLAGGPAMSAYLKKI